MKTKKLKDLSGKKSKKNNCKKCIHGINCIGGICEG